MSGKILGYNWSKTQCFQAQPITYCEFSVSFVDLRYIPTESLKTMGSFPEVLNFNWLFLQTQPSSSVTSGRLVLPRSLHWSLLE